MGLLKQMRDITSFIRFGFLLNSDSQIDPSFSQLGQLRTADLIRAHIEAQLKKACYGFSSHVEQMQTDTGTKDKFAQVWIDKLIEKARQMKKEEKQKPVAARKSEDKIAEELFAWLLEQPGDKFNPLLNLESMSGSIALNTLLIGLNF